MVHGTREHADALREQARRLLVVAGRGGAGLGSSRLIRFGAARGLKIREPLADRMSRATASEPPHPEQTASHRFCARRSP